MSDAVQNSTVHQLVEAQVAKTPDAIAVIFKDQQLTYRELNEKANQLAHYLRTLGVGPEVLVGICVERSLEMIIALLGILKAGGAYVPLDPAYPQERLAYMLEDSQAKVLLTQSQLIGLLPNQAVKTVYLDKDYEIVNQEPDDTACYQAQSDNLAYVIYTSGSTGQPKGVAMPHRPLVNLLLWQKETLKLPHARTLQFTPISFDVSFQEIFSAFCTGGTLVLIDQETRRNSEALLQYLSEYKIERLFLPYIALKHLAEVTEFQPNLPLYLREVITAGEQLKITRSIARWFSQLEGCTLYNHYGPSESHVVTAYELVGMPKDWPQLPPIGVPIANTCIYLLNPKLRRKDDPIELVADGEPGELAIGGIALARGYLNQPALTESKFFPDPFSNEPGARLYRTGDLVRYRSDGNLEYIERIDNQVKIRGVRIELGEIEVILSQHEAIKDAIVVAREDNSGTKYLVAYLTTLDHWHTQRNDKLSQQLRELLQEKLPTCMVPAAMVYLDTLPLTPSGKVDRRALPEPDPSNFVSSKNLVLPRNPLEEQLAAIWSQVLGNRPIGIYDNFFDLGGTSLQAIWLIFKVREAFHINLPIVTLFDAPTIDQFAECVKAIISAEEAKTSDYITVSQLEAEAVLDSTIDFSSSYEKPMTDPGKIFITGVTGYLGAFLLYELLEQTRASIYCLVRARDIISGEQKIRHNLEKYLLWKEEHGLRIIPVLGDLAEPWLGLSDVQFSRLADEIDVIYHNGASINLIYPYAALRAANVLGTQELLKLASKPKLKPVHFISTLDVFQTGRMFSSNVITERDELDPSAAVHFDGYTKSKWVSERMVTLAGRQGLPVAIYRPAMITGHSQTGVANVNDLMNRLIKGFVQLGSAPESEMMINIAPVDYFSQGAIYLSRQAESIGKTFNFINPQAVPMSQFIEVISACGYPVRQVEYEKWEDLLMQHADTLDGIISVLTSKSSATAVSYIERSSVGANLVSCQNVIDGLKNTSIVCPPIDAQLLNTYFSYFVRSGFLDAPKPLVSLIP